jgi:glycosyltransferase involved in cell wall biosynthesis
VNSSIAEELKRRYSLSSNPRVIYNIPLTTSAAGSNIRRKTSDKINLVYCGRYEASRGLPELIEAMQYLPESYELHLQGYGSLEFALKEQAKKLGLEHRIHFRSPVKKEQIVESLKFADVGVIAYQPVNLNNLYCTPNKLFEYIAAGLAIVASDVPELRKIVEKYHLGYLFNPYEPKDIASAIRKISSEKLPGLQKNARDAAAVLNWKNEEKKLFAIYEEVLN